MANPITTSIQGYVEENKSDLIAKSVLGGNSIALFGLMTGVVGPTTINLLTSDVTLQNGDTCGFTADGDQTISQRTITPKVIKVNMEYCDKNLLGTYASYMVKVGAGKETLPFEEKFIADVLANVNAKNEKNLFQGDKDNAGECDGLVTILTGESTVKTFTKGTTIWGSLKAVYAAMPEEVIVKDDAAMLISPANYRAFVQELVAANLYHYDDKDVTTFVYLPGTGIKVYNTPGLAGSDKVIAGSLSNIIVGVDMAGDAEEVKFWFSDDDDVYKLKISYSLGVNVAFPDQIVFGDVK